MEEGQSDELRGLLRITCSQSLGQTALVGAVAQYLKRHPQVAVDLQMNNRAVNLVEERIDLALRITNELDPNLIARPLSTCASVVCAAPAYLAAHGTPRQPQDLALHNCLTYSYFGKSLWHFDVQGVKSAVAVSGNLSANESVVLMAGTVQGRAFPCSPIIRRRRCWPAANWSNCCRITGRSRWASTASIPHAARCPPPCAPCWTFWWSGSPPIRSGRPRCADASAIFPRRFQRLTAAASRAAKAAAC